MYLAYTLQKILCQAAVILFSSQLNKITILSVPQKTKEALFAGFFRFIAFLELLFGSLFMLFCMFMQKKGKNKRY